MKKEEKPTLVRAEVIDNMVALNVGDNVYKPFFKGAIVAIEPIAFRNLERDGRVKAAPEIESRKDAKGSAPRKRKSAVSADPAVAEPRPNGSARRTDSSCGEPEAHFP